MLGKILSSEKNLTAEHDRKVIENNETILNNFANLNNHSQWCLQPNDS